MPKGYVVFTEAIHDRAGMDAYARASMPSLAEHGGRVLAVDEDVRVVEGQWHGDRTVLLEFESVEAARSWYESAGYQEAKRLREAASTSNGVIVKGFELPAR